MRLIALVVALAITACTTIQEVTPVSEPPPGIVCVVEHDAVMDGIRDAIVDSLADRGIRSRVVAGEYEKSHALWTGETRPAEVGECDALIFYVANWNWDIGYYMYFANLWMTDATGQRLLGRATYDASRNAGFGKFIKAEKKIRELMEEMLSEAS